MFVFQLMGVQTSFFPALWWRRESEWVEWEAALSSPELQPLSSFETSQWDPMNPLTHWLHLSRPRSLIQTSSCLRTKVSVYYLHTSTSVTVKSARFVLNVSCSFLPVSSPEIPNAGMLLHADCNEQEVMCEISRYTPRGLQESSDPAYFMVSLSVEGLDFSTSLILQTLPVEKDQTTLTQSKLSLPLSQSGTLLTKGKIQSSGLHLIKKNPIIIIKNLLHNIFPAFFAFLCHSNIPGVFRHKFCICSSERRCSPQLRLQAGGDAVSTRRGPGMASAAQRERQESSWNEDKTRRHRRGHCRRVLRINRPHKGFVYKNFIINCINNNKIS